MAKGDENVQGELLDRLDDQAVLAEIRSKNLALRDTGSNSRRRAPPARAARRDSATETTRRTR